MEDLNKIEKKLERLDLPDFEVSQHKRMLRHALLNSPYFERKGFVFNFKIMAPPLSAIAIILLFAFFGYPYLQYFYLEAKAEGTLDKSEKAVEELGSNKEIYAFTGEKGIKAPGLNFQIEEKTISTETFKEMETPKEIPPSLEQKLIKIEFHPSQLREARARGEIKFLQHLGEEKQNSTILEKIRYADQNNIITEIKINKATGLPAEITTWNFQKEIRDPKMIRSILPEKGTTTEIRIIIPNNQAEE